MRRLLRFAKDKLIRLWQLCKSTVCSGTALLTKQWRKIEVKLPLLKYFRSYWKVGAVYLGFTTLVGTGIIISATVQGVVPPLTGLGMVLLWPLVIVAYLATNPFVLGRTAATVGLLTVAYNAARKIVKPLAAVAYVGAEHIPPHEAGDDFGEQGAIVDSDRGEMIDVRTGEIVQLRGW